MLLYKPLFIRLYRFTPLSSISVVDLFLSNINHLINDFVLKILSFIILRKFIFQSLLQKLVSMKHQLIPLTLLLEMFHFGKKTYFMHHYLILRPSDVSSSAKQKVLCQKYNFILFTERLDIVVYFEVFRILTVECLCISVLVAFFQFNGKLGLTFFPFY